MFNNYEYFLILAEEQNVSKAAERLYISHQCLSKYLKKLELNYGIVLFDRKPQFAITYAGQLLAESLRKVEIIDYNIKKKFEELNQGFSGELRIGTTEGRLRLIMPYLIDEFKKIYPYVDLKMVSSKTEELVDMILKNKIDIAMVSSDVVMPGIQYDEVLNEQIYLVASDNLLQKYFGDKYPDCKTAFSNGADLKVFHDIPFVLNYPGFSSRSMIDKHLKKIGATLNCVNESTAMDLHHLMSARDYAASFCLSMYLQSIKNINNTLSINSPLNVFPILDFNEVNPIAIAYLKEKAFPEYAHAAMKIIKNFCEISTSVHI